MTQKTSSKRGWRRPAWQSFFGLWIVLLLTAIGIVGSDRWYRATYGRYEKAVPISWEIAEREELPLPEEAAKFGVRRWYAGYDATHTLVAYVVETTTQGFHEGSEIAVESVIRSDGELLGSMTVLEQHEDQYYGDRISLDSFAERFTGRYLPLLLPSESGRGSRIDALSGATGSSSSVLRAVNQAYSFLQTTVSKEAGT